MSITPVSFNQNSPYNKSKKIGFGMNFDQSFLNVVEEGKKEYPKLAKKLERLVNKLSQRVDGYTVGYNFEAPPLPIGHLYPNSGHVVRIAHNDYSTDLIRDFKNPLDLLKNVRKFLKSKELTKEMAQIEAIKANVKRPVIEQVCFGDEKKLSPVQKIIAKIHDMLFPQAAGKSNSSFELNRTFAVNENEKVA